MKKIIRKILLNLLEILDRNEEISGVEIIEKEKTFDIVFDEE